MITGDYKITAAAIANMLGIGEGTDGGHRRRDQEWIPPRCKSAFAPSTCSPAGSEVA
jgi:magnesium-transporting ATPase (P-type)